ncbi:MAG: quinoprotein dehydrogenase-associated putative ABC transporter substrate-binding protein [Hyphomicrobium sp.]
MVLRFPNIFIATIGIAVFVVSPASARELKVCADPNNMPFSNERGEGFENRIAKLIASDMGAAVKFVWAYEWRGFVRKGLNAGLCDVVPGVPANFERVRPTKPYYTTSYAFVQPAEAQPISSFDDGKLRATRIGVQLVGNDSANTPPMNELARRGITGGIRGYMVYGDWSKSDPLLPIVAGVAHHDVDVAVVWGPVADYYAALQSPPLRVTHIDNIPEMSFSIAMGVRKTDQALADEINRSLERRKSDISRILADYHIHSSALPKASATAE